jgi:hypothetical protein
MVDWLVLYCQPFRIARSRNRPEMYEILSYQECLMKLRHNCCGRELTHRARSLQPSVRRVEDPHHPSGYRELRSPAEMRKLLKRKVREQNGICAICHHEFIDYNDIVPDHRDPKGMGGSWRDDHPDNIQATHWWCNGEKGSTRMDD